MSHFNDIPVKIILEHIPVIGEVVTNCLPQLQNQDIVNELPENLPLSEVSAYFNLNASESKEFVDAIEDSVRQIKEIEKKEIAEFGVEVDEDDPCHAWSNDDKIIQEACVSAIEEKYRGQTGAIIFYGPSNIQMWYSLEKDMLPYKAQNHGMGGCIDTEMMAYAPRMLYAFKPSVVFFQTGSNDLANGLSLEQILKKKRKCILSF